MVRAEGAAAFAGAWRRHSEHGAGSDERGLAVPITRRTGEAPASEGEDLPRRLSAQCVRGPPENTAETEDWGTSAAPTGPSGALAVTRADDGRQDHGGYLSPINPGR